MLHCPDVPFPKVLADGTSTIFIPGSLFQLASSHVQDVACMYIDRNYVQNVLIYNASNHTCDIENRDQLRIGPYSP